MMAFVKPPDRHAAGSALHCEVTPCLGAARADSPKDRLDAGRGSAGPGEGKAALPEARSGECPSMKPRKKTMDRVVIFLPS